MAEEIATRHPDTWNDLVTSMLAVNNFSAEKAFALLPALEREGLTNPVRLARWSTEECIRRLKDAGFNRGSFMNNLMADRLCGLGRAVHDKGITAFEHVIAGTDKQEITNLLMPIAGIGAVVLGNFFMLRNLRN